MDKSTRYILATAFAQGKTHDFALFKASRLPLCRSTQVKADSGYLGLARWHPKDKVQLPHKKSKHHPLTIEQKQIEQKQQNTDLARERAPVEGGIGWLKRFAILCGPYRNKGKRFALRFNLLAALYNAHL